MTEPIRVLVVDDSVVIRRLLTTIIDADPDLEVAGTAANGSIALQRVAQLQPDIVTLDIEMPEMNGLEALKALRVSDPKLPIIMFSTLTERGAEATLEALSRGAADYVTKPANVGSVGEAMDRVRGQLVPKVKALCPRATPPVAAVSRAASVVPDHIEFKPATDRADIVAIGSSTGGPVALAEVLSSLPEDLAVPVVVVQHMPPVFTGLLANRLDETCAVSVHEGSAGMLLEAGHVYIAPGDFHMTVEGTAGAPRLATNQDPQVNYCRPAVDVLFQSVADVFGGNVLTVVLTGMGSDGRNGCAALKREGAHVLVQDEASSTVWGMPGAVDAAGLADEVIDLSTIGRRIVRRTSRRTLFATTATVH